MYISLYSSVIYNSVLSTYLSVESPFLLSILLNSYLSIYQCCLTKMVEIAAPPFETTPIRKPGNLNFHYLHIISLLTYVPIYLFICACQSTVNIFGLA